LAKQMEDSELRGSMRGERDSKAAADEQARRSAIDHATDEFENKMFVKIYQSHRPRIRQQVLAALRKAGGNSQSAGESPESKWWDCFMADDAEVLKRANSDKASGDIEDDPGFDKEAGIYLDPTKATVSNEEAMREIEDFMHVSPPCPWFRDLHDGELKKHVVQATGQH
jgi:hypothetical protein